MNRRVTARAFVSAAVAFGAVCAGMAALLAARSLGSAYLPLIVALGVLVAVVWLPLALRRPEWAVLVLVVVAFANLGEQFQAQGVTLYLVALAVALASCAWNLALGRLRPAWSPVYLFALVFFAAQLITVFVASDQPAFWEAIIELAKDYAFLAVLAIWMPCSRRNMYLACVVAVCTIGVLAGLTLVQEFVFANSTDFFGLARIASGSERGVAGVRHTGPQFDANFWARSLVLFAPVALSLFGIDRGTLRRWIWLAAALVISGGVVLTGSRGGLLGIGLVWALWFFIAGRQYRRWLLAAPLVIVIVLTLPGVGSRLVTLDSLDAGPGRQIDDPSIEGRATAQAVALEMFRENPVLGVGYGNFMPASDGYIRELGLPQVRLDPHNIYLQVAAQSGIIGLAALFLFYGSAFFAAVRAILRARRLRSGPAWRVNLFAVAAVCALAGWVFTSIFLHAAELRLFYFVIVLAVAADVVGARYAEEGETGDEDPSHAWPEPVVAPEVRSLRLRAGAAGVGVFVLVFSAGMWLFGVNRVWVGEAAGLVKPGPATPQGYEGYTQILAGYPGLLGSFAEVIDQPGFKRDAADQLGLDPELARKVSVTVSSRNNTTVILATAASDSRAEAEEMASAVLATGAEFVNTKLDGVFVVEPVAGDSGVSAGRMIAIDGGAAVAVFLVAAGLAVVVSLLVVLFPGGPPPRAPATRNSRRSPERKPVGSPL